MNLDDRMRSAHKRQLDDITNQTQGNTFTARPTPVLQRLAPVVGVVFVAIIAIFGVRAVVGSGPTSLETVDSTELDAAGTPPASPESGNAEVPVEVPATTAAVPDPVATTTIPEEPVQPEDTAPEEAVQPEQTVAPETTVASGDAVAPQTTVQGEEPPQPQETVASETTVAPDPSPTTTVATAVVDAGLPTVICESGRRAPLELAELQYLGSNVGWNRLDDLVDEQDNEFTFEAWEPGFPDEVTVQVTLNTSVDAVDIRVAQDPFTPVSGDIEISTFFDGDLVDTFSIPLSGLDGWIVNTFDAPTRIDRFEITRNGPSENIMEVLVCVQ